MELVCGSWESINSPYRKTLRVQYAEKSTRREFARNYDPFSLSSSSQFRTPTYFYLPPLSLSLFLSTPLFFISHRITSLPVPPTGFSYCLFMSSISPSRPAPHFLHFSLRPLSNFHLSNSCVTTASYLTFAFFSLLAEKMPMARQKTVLHEVTGCQTFLSGLEGSPVFRSRYVHGDSTHGRGA